MLTPAELVALPKGQAFALLEGGALWKLRMPLPDAHDDPLMPANFAAIAAAMTRAHLAHIPPRRDPESWWRVAADASDAVSAAEHD